MNHFLGCQFENQVIIRITDTEDPMPIHHTFKFKKGGGCSVNLDPIDPKLSDKYGICEDIFGTEFMGFQDPYYEEHGKYIGPFHYLTFEPIIETEEWITFDSFFIADVWCNGRPTLDYNSMNVESRRNYLESKLSPFIRKYKILTLRKSLSAGVQLKLSI
jgi:hypothetical protein